MFHITGIFPPCILLTPGADKMLRASKRTAFLRGAYSDRMSECRNITRGLFTRLLLSMARYSTQQRPIQLSKKTHKAELRAAGPRQSPPTVGFQTTACFQTASKTHFNKLFSLAVSVRLLNSHVYKWVRIEWSTPVIKRHFCGLFPHFLIE